MRRLPLTIVTLALAASACSSDDPVAQGADDSPAVSATQRNDDGEVVVSIDGDELVLTSALSGFGGCDALLDHLRTEAVERVSPWGFESGGWFARPVPFARSGFDVAEAESDSNFTGTAEPSSSFDGGSEDAAVEGVDFSGTNVQETGVDEADIIKTDGERVYLVAAGQLVVVDVSERAVLGSVDLPDSWSSELFLAGDELLLVGSGWLEEGLGASAERDPADDAEASFADDVFVGEPWLGTNIVRVTRLSIDGLGRPSVVESIVVEGDAVSARAVNGVARVTIRSNPQRKFPFVFPQSESGEDAARAANQAAVRSSELSHWLPTYGIERADGTVTDTGLLADCGAVHAPTAFAGFGVLSVLSVPVAGDLDRRDTTSVLAPGDIVYGSTESIYVATQTWPDWGILEDAEGAWDEAWNARQTSIHRFALSDTGAAYTASGSVAGDVHNQFSFSEHDGHLRVVTTTGDTWDQTSESFVRVLRETDGELVEVGQVGDMGNGEAVQSVRFVGDVGYVVTFRQIDPFYTLDLSDPENPRVVGELKIPGFSSYLHPIGDGRVLGIGSDADLDGRVTGSKVSVFDVSDPANPLEVSVWQAPGAWNDIGWEHRSFLWWAPESLAVVPVNVWEDGENWAGAVVLKVEGTTIEEVGRIDHLDGTGRQGETECDVVTSDSLGALAPEAVDLLLDSVEGGALFLQCDPGEAQTAIGYDCFEDPQLREAADEFGVEVPPETSLVWCWPSYSLPTISRSVVLDGDELWTLSSAWGYPAPESPVRLQINDLESFERLGHLTFA